MQPCQRPGCRALADARYCAEHAPAERGRFDRERGSAASRGYGRRHERWRKMILARDPLCMIQKLCGRGISPDALPAPATHADHIVPVRAGGEWSMENGQGACQRCHGWKTALERRN